MHASSQFQGIVSPWYFRSAPGLARMAVLLALAALLVWHVHTYWFLTDDAFISFRYARNLSEGHGLVFNPGDEPVEGYTNFLWVILLAAGSRVGILPEHAAPVLGLLMTLLLWGGATWFGRRYILGAQGRAWWWVAPLVLASNRSFAVWATGGLETRLFELLVMGGLAFLWRETSAAGELRNECPRRVSFGTTLLALATLTRPDAAVVALGAGAVLEWTRWRGGHWRWKDVAATWMPYVLIVGAHEIWRVAYYRDPLPNTFYAKFGGRYMGEWGIPYLALFAIEYALPVWIPLVTLGARQWSRYAPGLGSLVAGALVPFAAYVAYSGGDHFEYRQIDVVWVPLALLVQSGAARLSRWRLRAFAAVATVVGLATVLPSLSRGGFDPAYMRGALGVMGRPEDGALVRTERVPSFLRPVVAPWFGGFNTLSKLLMEDLVALRQEEHWHFIAETTAAGLDLRDLVARGIFPADTRIALNCVGAIPYYSRLWTLDRIGLCDRQVARMPASRYGRLGHLRMATPDYIRSRHVDIEPVMSYNFFVSDNVVNGSRVRRSCDGPNQCWVARIGPGLNMLAILPQGIEHARVRFPAIPFEPLVVDKERSPH